MISFRLISSNFFLQTKLIRSFHTTNAHFKNILRPHVELPWAYAYGRSTEPLRNVTVAGILQYRAENDGNRTAVVSHHEGISKTLSELNDEVNRLSAGLYNKLGVRRGDVVGIWSLNSYNWIVAEYAAMRLGAIVCTINPVYKMAELEYVLKSGLVKCLFMPGLKSKQEKANGFYDLLSKSEYVNANNNNQLKHVIHMDGECPKQKFGNVFAHQMSTLYDNNCIDKEVLDAVDTDDPCIIMYTSGTTGKPKGAVLSNHTIANNALLSANKLIDREANNAICLPLPLFHSFAAVLGSVSMAAIPATIVLTGFWFEVESVVKSIVRDKCNLLLATPTMIIDVMSYVEKNNIKIDSLKCALLGGAAVPIEVATKIQQVIPSCTDVRVGYGATELGPVTSASVIEDEAYKKLETAGGPLDYVELKIVDPLNNKLMKIGERGELLVRGHNVMIGYWKDEQKTKEVITETGWYKTGDIAVMEETGYIKIVGRTKELVIRGGENIYPREVEELLHTHSNIEMAAVCGVPDDRVGEELCAWIKLKDPNKSLTADEVKSFCKDKITYFKIPKYIMFVDDFPMTITRKVKKFEMTEKSCEILGLSKRN